MTMERALNAIVEGIPSGHYFDSHYVIDQLRKLYSDRYMAYMRSLPNADEFQAHGLLAQRITLMSGIAQKVDGLSFSMNINGEGSPCALWRRL
jgi:hypothetical protein